MPDARTLLLTHADLTAHDPGPGHVERPDRMRAIDIALSGASFATLQRRAPPLREDAEDAALAVHTPQHLAHLKTVAAKADDALARIDGDTAMSRGTLPAVWRALSAGLEAVDAVMASARGAANAFCQVRPPGHHAEQARAMGFCFLSNVAIAAHHARRRHGATRIAVVDFDVHHGNGTQRIFWDDKNLFFGSTHEMPLFPGTGAASETGAGNIFNAPLKAGDGSAQFRAAMGQRILPALDAFKPELILISAGFDAHADDPLGHINLTDQDFAWITTEICAAADKHCAGRVVSMLEGGYDLEALGTSAAAHVSALMAAAT